MDKKWLESIGVSGSAAELDELTDLITSALELRVGAALAEAFTEEQLEEFEELMDSNAAEDERLAMLEGIYPDYKNVVEQETIRLRRNIRQSSDKAAYIRSLM